jgi:sulfur-carrier protein adenylyltransferase/sulfurtransferase
VLTILTDHERDRYSRQIILPEFGDAGQIRLKQSSVLLVGSGALGSPAALYLAAAGVGRLVVVDGDSVELSNLHRQILHRQDTVGQPKADSARTTLIALNPHIDLKIHSTRLTPDNAMSLADGCALIVDGCDNFPTRFLTNDLGFFLGRPVVHGAIDRFHGQVSVFAPHAGGPCYRCLLPALPPPGAVPSCQEAGVIGALPGIIGSMMAMEAIKCLLGIGSPLIGRLQIYDALAAESRILRIRRDPQCALCGTHPTIPMIHNAETTAPISCASHTDTITPGDLQRLLQDGFSGRLVDVREPYEHASARIEGSYLIPLGQLRERLHELPRDREIILHCKMGGRSAKALAFLQSQGYDRIRHLEGGMDAWLQLPAPHEKA